MTDGPTSMSSRGSGGLVIALDGPAASGKSSVGARVAEVLGYRFVDTGLLYRGVTWLALRHATPLTSGEEVAALVPRVSLVANAKGRLESVLVDGRDVTSKVVGPEVDRAVSEVARQPEVRQALLARQRALAAGGGIVVAGRDIGTVVLPDADVKIFLEASAEERAMRRAAQRGLARDSSDAAAILADLRRRDEIDRGRATAPLKAADDAVHIVTDGLGLKDSVQAVVDVVRRVIGTSEAERVPQEAVPAALAPELEAELEAEPEAEYLVAPVPDPVALEWEPEPAREAAEPEPEPEPAAVESAAQEPEPQREASTSAPVPLPRSRRPSTTSKESPLGDHVTPFITLTDWVGRTITTSITRVHIEGLDEPLGIEGSLIVAANHASNLDGVLVASWLTPALGRRIYLIGKQEALDVPLMGWALGQNAVIGIRRGAADLEAYRAARRILDEGHVLGLFPEGTRSPDGRLQEAKEGAAILALRTGAPILPIGISGSHKFWPRGQKLFRPGGHVRMRVGEPFRLDPVAAADRRRGQRDATRQIMTKIAELLPPSQRGVYADDVERGRAG